MGVEGKRLLVLGAGRGQIGLYKAAKEMGITTIAGTMPDNNPPGIPLADEVCFMNIANPDEVAKKAANLKLDRWLLAVWIQEFQLLEKLVILWA